MRIVHLIGYFQPEFGYREFYIAKNEAKLGHTVYVITSDRIYPFPNLAELSKKINRHSQRSRKHGYSFIDGIHVFRLPALLEFKSAIVVMGIKKLLRRIKPDFVHAYEIMQITPLFGALYKKNAYALLIDNQQFEIPRTFLGKLYFYSFGRLLVRYSFSKADGILFTTPESKKFTSRWFQINDKKVAQIPLGFDPAVFYFDSEGRQSIRNKLGVADNEYLIITSGKVTKEKNYEIILCALAQLNKNFKLKLLIVGSGDERYLTDIKELARKLGLTNTLIVHDFVEKDELKKFYSAADIGIWPDQPSITIVEAMGCGLPVILPKLNVVKHLIEYGNGMMFNKNDSTDLKHIITKIFKDDAMIFYHMRKHARSGAKERFSYLNIAGEIIDFAKSLSVRRDRVIDQKPRN